MELELTESPPADELLGSTPAAGSRRGCGIESAGSPAAGQPQGPGRERLLPDRRSRVAFARTGRTNPAVALAASTSLVRRPNRSAPIDLRASLLRWRCGKTCLEMRLQTDPGGSAGPRDVLAALGLEDLEHEGIALTRTDVEIDS